ncbi:MAG TPA: hypothetical protein PKE45_17775, partial [Caldilineaceae bacterium]|nr:hypothetical protein [Caldilineaceae bacterium]
WRYTASGSAAQLETATGLTLVSGCDPDQSGDPRNTYFNLGMVRAAGLVDSDPSHYCNPPPQTLDDRKEPVISQQRVMLPMVQGRQ